MLKAIHGQEDHQAAQEKAMQVATRLDGMKLPAAARLVREGIEETLSYMSFPREYWCRIRTNNPMERIMREIRRRTRVVGCFRWSLALIWWLPGASYSIHKWEARYLT
jgi:transposase-like protein